MSITVLPRKERHAGISEDDHFHEKWPYGAISACRYKARYAFPQNFCPFSYTFLFTFKSIVSKLKYK